MTWTVLVVEDDAEISTLLAGVLTARGLRVVTAANGAEAIAQCMRTAIKPSVIVLDVMMPIMGGLEFLEVQPTVGLLAEVPVIIASATPPTRGLSRTVIAVLAKPIKLAELIALIHDACGGLHPVRSTLEIEAIPRTPEPADDDADPPPPAAEATSSE